MSGLLLGVDLGTTALKGVLASPDGRIVAQSSVDLPPVHASGATLEQDPREWWRGLVSVCRHLASNHDLASVTAIGLSGQTHGVVPVSPDGQPTRPCLTWADKRAAAESADLERRLGRRIRAVTCNDVDPTFSAPKLAWLALHEPDSLEQTARIVLPKDYLRAMLTGEWATDPSDAASTLLFDLAAQRWDRELVTEIGIDPDLLPDVQPSGAVAGHVTAAAAAATGLPPGTPVVTGASDVACAALGAGLIDEGTVYANVGTAAQILAVAPSLEAGAFYVFQHALPATFLRMTSVFAAGLSHAWVTRLLTGSESAVGGYERLDRAAADLPPGSNGVVFLPYLLGRGLPQPDPNARGAFFGLTPGHGPAEVYRAVLEGVAYAIRVGVESLGTSSPAGFSFGGGARRSALWTSIIADVLGAPLRPLGYDASPIGAVMLAGLGIGTFTGPSDAVARFVHHGHEVEPHSRRRVLYEGLYQSFVRLAHSDHGAGPSDTSVTDDSNAGPG